MGDSNSSSCPLPPYKRYYHPAKRTALASHPRCGSTWLRFMLEHATGFPCGFEHPGWANVLPHVGGESDRSAINRQGLVVKSHNVCHGCWRGAALSERWTIQNRSKWKLADINKSVGRNTTALLQEHGACLVPAAGNLDVVIGMYVREKTPTLLPCVLPHDRAVLLTRDPLDVFRSNYHYRTYVLRLREPGTWARNSYEFPLDRAHAYVALYRSWLEFAKHKPLLKVKYEDLRNGTAVELRRILTFLELPFMIPDSKITCSIEASSMDRLKNDGDSTHGKVGSQKFFGSRQATTSREDLSYPLAVLSKFERLGVYEVANSLGYSSYTGEAKAQLIFGAPKPSGGRASTSKPAGGRASNFQPSGGRASTFRPTGGRAGASKPNSIVNPFKPGGVVDASLQKGTPTRSSAFAAAFPSKPLFKTEGLRQAPGRSTRWQVSPSEGESMSLPVIAALMLTSFLLGLFAQSFKSRFCRRVRAGKAKSETDAAV